ncbi:hypothetical protein GC167_05695 [bacterium]|nr:hypothetical protein [bacterium]
MKKALILLGLIWSTAVVHAQKIKQFSEVPENFLGEMNSLIRELDKEQAEATMLSFGPVFRSFEADRQTEFIGICNEMLRKRIQSKEAWYDLLHVAQRLYEGEEEELQSAWYAHYKELVRKSPNRESQAYLHICALNFSDSLIGDERGILWKAAGGERRFVFEGRPSFVYTGIDLLGWYKTDSTLLEKTSGILYPEEGRFVGKGGRVYFARSGFGRDTVHADLKRYEIFLDKTGFRADSAVLTSLIYLTQPEEGVLTEQLSSQSEVENAAFPRFESYRKDILIPEIAPGVDYRGGFSMVGPKLFGAGNQNQWSSLIFKHENKPLFRIASDRFRLRTDLIAADAARLSLYVGEDSISHPKLAFRYIIPAKILSLFRDNEGLSQSAFTNTFHNMEMRVEFIRWVQGEPSIDFSNSQGGGAATFESQQYFRYERMEQIQGLNSTNPLYYLQWMSETYKRRDMKLEEVASALKMTPNDAERFLMSMMVGGFVHYDLVAKEVHLNDKLFDYVRDFEGKRDYDVIRFSSQVPSGVNARLSLLNYDLDIAGIEMIAVSDSQKVSMFPKGQRITVQEGFNFNFDGLIKAGRFSFWGNQYFFNYDQFKVNMNDIDSMRFKVESFEANSLGQKTLVDVKNTLQDINGELFIDRSDNKSGKKSYPDYPIFKSGKESYVYYDRKDIFDKVYPRERFYIELVPFTIDSLDNAKTESLKFEGTFVSAGIFPDLPQTVTVQKDYSLGFIAETPSEGYATYGGEGQSFGQIALSNKGLIGTGRIEYLASTSTSQAFYYFPDSTLGHIDQYELRAVAGRPGHPHCSAVDSKMRWIPGMDVMHQYNADGKPFALYDDIGMIANGRVSLGPGGLKGRGVIDFLDAQMRAQTFVFEHRNFRSDTADFKVRSGPTADYAFAVKGAQSAVDFDRQKGDFLLQGPKPFFDFTINQYRAFMDKAEWLIPQKAVSVSKVGPNASSMMLSTNRIQDSLRYVAGSARIDLLPSVLEVFQANEIDVADARIFPDSGRVTIDSAADMRILRKSRLVASRVNQFHQLHDCELKIQSRKSFTGTGTLDYLDEDQTPWPLFFHTLKVSRQGTTQGMCDVKQEDEFYMSSFFAFYGKVSFESPTREMLFDGFTLIQNSCENIVTTWFPFKSPIDPKNIIIDLPVFGEDLAAERLFNGIFIGSDSSGAYSAFLTKGNAKLDLPIIRADGQLYYDKAMSSYVVARKERIVNPNSRGNYVAFDNDGCTTQGQGEVNLTSNTGMLTLKNFGLVDHDLKTDEIQADVTMLLDFPFPEDILKAIAEDLNKSEGRGGGSDLNRKAYKIQLVELLEKKEKDKFEEFVKAYGAIGEIPDPMRSVFQFAEVKFKWNKFSNSFITTGPLGFGGMGKTPITKRFKGSIEIVRKRRGDEYYLYFESGSGAQYYFEYKRNVMSFYSSKAELVTMLTDLDPDKKRIEGDGNRIFNITVASKSKMNRYVNRIE